MTKDAQNNEVVLKVEHLTKHYPIKKGLFGKSGACVHALEDASFEVHRGETFAIVGESGCEVKPKRVGGATYQVPMEVNSRRATTLAIRWMVNFSRARKENSMAERLANEILDASNGVGASVKKREDLFKMAEANRAFSHYRF